MPTVFEKIIAGELPVNKVYEDEETFAFLDANPVNPGHTLVIPKEPYKDIYDVPEDTLAATMKTVKLLAQKLKEALGADGVNILQNNESAAGQVVFHLHFHLIPRFEGDGFEHWQGKEDWHADGAGDDVAVKIRAVLK